MPHQLSKQFALHVRKHVTTTSLRSSHPGLWWKTALWIFNLSRHICQSRGHFGEFYTWNHYELNWMLYVMISGYKKDIGVLHSWWLLARSFEIVKNKKDRASEVVSHPPRLMKKRILELLHFRSCKSWLLSTVGVQAGALLETGLCWEQIWLHEGGVLV